MKYMPSFINIGSAILKLMGEGVHSTQTEWRPHEPALEK
jgi:hypothetical protein